MEITSEGCQAGVCVNKVGVARRDQCEMNKFKAANIGLPVTDLFKIRVPPKTIKND